MWANIVLHKNKIFAIILVIGFYYWIKIDPEDFDDPYVISVDYDCRAIVREPSDIPKDIVEQCEILIEALNEPK